MASSMVDTMDGVIYQPKDDTTASSMASAMTSSIAPSMDDTVA